MPINLEQYRKIREEIKAITLVAVSKTKSNEDILALYDLGQRDFGENYVQELVDKEAALPKDIRWHFIGHLQTNKVKSITGFVHLIHGVDSLKLLKEINKQAAKCRRVVDCLLQVHIAQEETKFGMNEIELDETLAATDVLANVRICGLMGMASLSDDPDKIRSEFKVLRSLFEKVREWAVVNTEFTILSMGMSSDYAIAAEEGSTMIRIGSLLFGARSYHQ